MLVSEKYSLDQGDLLRGTVNWSDAAQSVAQGPKQSPCQQIQ